MVRTALFAKMATDVVAPLLENQFDRLSVASEESIVRSDAGKEDQDDPVLEEWGLPLKELYRLAINFYKEKEGKAVHLSYPDKLRLVALKTQVSRGSFSDAGGSLPPLGVLDVIGRDRRAAWQALGSMSRHEAMLGFVDLLRAECALFTPSVHAARTDMAEQRRIKHEEERLRKEEEQRVKEEEERKRKEEEERTKQEAQRRQVQDALNAQTYTQFVAYCRAQFPADADRQATLLRQLQEHHYAQYMRQLAAGPVVVVAATETPVAAETEAATTGDDDDSDGDDAPQASMWTRKDVGEFKAAIRREASDAVIRVGHGETVTVRVPTHPDGACLFWEFATDAHDIGFGVFFEWTQPSTNQVSVHVAESDDDEEDDDDDEDGEEGSDLERSVGGKLGGELPLRPPTSVIVPVYRRDCQEEVYAGSHVYPGQGVYLLKFDNSYSLWRSKTLYYRVYYTR